MLCKIKPARAPASNKREAGHEGGLIVITALTSLVWPYMRPDYLFRQSLQPFCADFINTLHSNSWHTSSESS